MFFSPVLSTSLLVHKTLVSFHFYPSLDSKSEIHITHFQPDLSALSFRPLHCTALPIQTTVLWTSPNFTPLHVSFTHSLHKSTTQSQIKSISIVSTPLNLRTNKSTNKKLENILHLNWREKMAVLLFNELGIKSHLVISVSLSLDITWYNIFRNIVVILTECPLFLMKSLIFMVI